MASGEGGGSDVLMAFRNEMMSILNKKVDGLMATIAAKEIEFKAQISSNQGEQLAKEIEFKA
jgi:hypothetical protein